MTDPFTILTGLVTLALGISLCCIGLAGVVVGKRTPTRGPLVMAHETKADIIASGLAVTVVGLVLMVGGLKVIL